MRVPFACSLALPALLALSAGTPASGAARAGAAGPEITLSVDATEARRHLLHVRELLPAGAGPLSLSYPEWIPGEHGPTGPLTDVVGLVIRAGSRTLAWRRDDVDMYTVRAEVPPGAASVEVDFDFLLSTSTAGYSSASCSTENLLLLSWNQVLFYPTGRPSDELAYRADVTLPAGWKYGTSLTAESEAGGRLRFPPVSLTTLVDSPVLAGAHFRRVDLAPGATPRYFLDMAADGEAALAMADSDVAVHRRLVREAHAFFGGWHHGDYHFLLTLSDHTAHFGLEHHASSDDRVPERMWVDEDQRRNESTLLSHELSHSWNGKYRRPAGLATPDFGKPMKGELLYVYEGLTQYSGWVLACRSGVLGGDGGRQLLAWKGASMDAQRGRDWRPLADTAIEAQRLYEARNAWENWRRSVDFYDESLLIWLEADVTIRSLTHDAKSLDDFCHLFHGGTGPAELKPYTFDDIVSSLNAVAPYDWTGFLRTRVDAIQKHAPLGGITGSGWTLAWTDTASAVLKSAESADEECDHLFSIGIKVDRKTGNLIDVTHGSPADLAGLTPDMKLVAINGRHWDEHVLADAIAATAKGAPLELLVDNADFYRTYRIDWKGGLRYPVLRRDTAKPDRLTAILSPHAR